MFQTTDCQRPARCGVLLRRNGRRARRSPNPQAGRRRYLITFRLDTIGALATLLARMAEQQSTPTTGASTTPPVSRGKIFLRRLASSVALWTIVLLAIFSENRL